MSKRILLSFLTLIILRFIKTFLNKRFILSR